MPTTKNITILLFTAAVLCTGGCSSAPKISDSMRVQMEQTAAARDRREEEFASKDTQARPFVADPKSMPAAEIAARKRMGLGGQAGGVN
jgi:hypothetical protein